jgi:hypothetical protein
MLLGKKTLGFALAGLAVYAWYKYAQLSDQEKKEMVDNLKSKGKKILDSVKSKVSSDGQPYSEGAPYVG